MAKNKEIKILEKELGVNEHSYNIECDSNGHIISIDLYEPEYYDIPIFENDVFDTLSKFPYLEKIEIDLCIPKSKNINKLSTLKNLKSIVLNDAPSINDISELAALSKLETLNLMYSEITDISSLSDLLNLKHLIFYKCRIASLSPLCKLENLGTLNITSKNILEIPELQNLKRLQYLHLSDNSISDLSPIRNLTNLTSLSLSGNRIQNLNELKNLAKLQSLNLDFNSIDDAQLISSFPDLGFLTIVSNNIKDFSFIEFLPKLQHLDISGNPVTHYPERVELNELKTFSSNSVPNIGINIIKGSPAISTLILKNCIIKELDFLKDLANLSYVNLSNNQISDISPLLAFDKLRTIDLSNNLLEEVIPIFEFPSLQFLDLSGNKFGNTPIGHGYGTPSMTLEDFGLIIGEHYFKAGSYDDALSYYYGSRKYGSKTSVEKELNVLSIYMFKLKTLGSGNEYFLKFYLYKCASLLRNNANNDHRFRIKQDELVNILDELGINYQQYIEENTTNGNLHNYYLIKEYVIYRNEYPSAMDNPEALFQHAVDTLSSTNINNPILIYKDLVRLASPFKYNLLKRIYKQIDELKVADQKYYKDRLASPANKEIIYFDYKSAYKEPEPRVYVSEISGNDTGLKLTIIILAIVLFIIILMLIMTLLSYPG